MELIAITLANICYPFYNKYGEALRVDILTLQEVLAII